MKFNELKKLLKENPTLVAFFYTCKKDATSDTDEFVSINVDKLEKAKKIGIDQIVKINDDNKIVIPAVAERFETILENELRLLVNQHVLEIKKALGVSCQSVRVTDVNRSNCCITAEFEFYSSIIVEMQIFTLTDVLNNVDAPDFNRHAQNICHIFDIASNMINLSQNCPLLTYKAESGNQYMSIEGLNFKLAVRFETPEFVVSMTKNGEEYMFDNTPYFHTNVQGVRDVLNQHINIHTINVNQSIALNALENILVHSLNVDCENYEVTYSSKIDGQKFTASGKIADIHKDVESFH